MNSNQQYHVVCGRNGDNREIALAMGVAFGNWASELLLKNTPDSLARSRRDFLHLPRPIADTDYFTPEWLNVIVQGHPLYLAYRDQLVTEWIAVKPQFRLSDGIHRVPHLVLTHDVMTQVNGTMLLTTTKAHLEDDWPMTRSTAKKFGYAFGLWAADIIAARDQITQELKSAHLMDLSDFEEMPMYCTFLETIGPDSSMKFQAFEELLYEAMRRVMVKTARHTLKTKAEVNRSFNQWLT